MIGSIDIYGLDPLVDRGFLALKEITSYNKYTIKSDQNGRPDLISFQAYGSTDMWWVILAFNGITDVRLLTEGKVIKLPSYDQLISIISSKNTSRTTSSVSI